MTTQQHQLPVDQPNLFGPAFTKKEEDAELATLTIDDVLEIEKDLRGVTAGMGNMTMAKGAMTASEAPLTKKRRSRESHSVTENEPVVVTNADLYRLEEELLRIPLMKKQRYVEATLKCPQQVNRDHKAAFLEREALNATRAARRIVAYWDIRFATFGEDRCFLPMTLSGAMQDEVAGMMKYSMYQLLPKPDSSGRAVMFLDYGRRDFNSFTEEQEKRAIFYLYDTIATDPQTRQAGVVVIATAKNANSSNSSSELQKYVRVLVERAMPVRICCHHLLHPSRVYFYLVYPVLKYFMGRDMRVRGRVHYGSDKAVIQELETYGMHRARLPTEIGGELELDAEIWFAEQSVKETMRLALESKAVVSIDADPLTSATTTTPMSLDTPSPPLSMPKQEARIGSGDEDTKPGADSGVRLDAFVNKDMTIAQSSSASKSPGFSSVITEEELTGEEARREIIDTFNAQLLQISEQK